MRRRVRTLEEQLEAHAREVVELRARVVELEAHRAPASDTLGGARATTVRCWHAVRRRAERVIRVARRSVT